MGNKTKTDGTFEEVEVFVLDSASDDHAKRNNAQYQQLYYMFMYFWTSQFIIAVGEIIMALAFAMWYFTRDKGTIGTPTVIKSITWGFWYHAGTAAFGSFIIAIIKLIRFIIMEIQKKIEQMPDKPAAVKATARALMCACQCYMWCV